MKRLYAWACEREWIMCLSACLPALMTRLCVHWWKGCVCIDEKKGCVCVLVCVSGLSACLSACLLALMNRLYVCVCEREWIMCLSAWLPALIKSSLAFVCVGLSELSAWVHFNQHWLKGCMCVCVCVCVCEWIVYSSACLPALMERLYMCVWERERALCAWAHV